MPVMASPAEVVGGRFLPLRSLLSAQHRLGGTPALFGPSPLGALRPPRPPVGQSHVTPLSGRGKWLLRTGLREVRQVEQALRVYFLNFLDRVETTMIYTHVVRDLRNSARSPLDMLGDGGRGPAVG